MKIFFIVFGAISLVMGIVAGVSFSISMSRHPNDWDPCASAPALCCGALLPIMLGLCAIILPIVLF